ncbi:MAG: hypothetical protein QOK15_2187 [Nocardioidaceae bacterium]|nr:hypothetical protein [Nocardioidaceae bacterium]
MSHVALTTGGRYLRVLERDGEQRVAGDVTALSSADAFDRVELPHGRIALRSADGCFLTRRPDRDLSFGLYPEADLTPAAVFEEVLWPNGEVSLRSADLTYVGASPALPAVTVNRVEPGPCERFTYVPVADALVPAPRRPASPARHHVGASSR